VRKHPGIYLEGLKQTTNILSHESHVVEQASSKELRSVITILNLRQYITYLYFNFQFKVSEKKFPFQPSTRLRAGRSEFRIPAGAREFSLPQNIQTGPGTHPASYSTGYFRVLKRTGRDVDHLPPSSAVVKNERS
jgi:hypothetical protein